MLVFLTKAGRRWTVKVLGVLLLASVASQVYWSQADPTHAYYGTDSRIYQPLAGAVLALVVHRLPLGGGRRSGDRRAGRARGLPVPEQRDPRRRPFVARASRPRWPPSR